METYARNLALDVPGEALNSVLFRMQFLNAKYASAGMPVWETEVSEIVDDTVRVDFTAPLPEFNGNILLGVHQAPAGFTPLSGYNPAPTFAHIPDDVSCTVCGTRRARSHLVFLNPEKELQYVGRSCLSSFVETESGADRGAPVSPDTVKLFSSNPVSLLEDTIASISNATHIDTNLVIAAALWLTDERGYVNRTRSDQLGLRSTSEEIFALLSAGQEVPEQVRSRVLPAAVLRQWALDEMQDESEFANKLKIALSRPSLTRHSFGLVAALPTAYRRATRVEAALDEGDPIPGADYAEGHIGTPGIRERFENAIVEGVRVLTTGSTLVALRSAGGHRLTWFTTTEPNRLPAEGSHVSFAGTVKAHREFRGVTETVLARCHFE